VAYAYSISPANHSTTASKSTRTPESGGSARRKRRSPQVGDTGASIDRVRRKDSRSLRNSRR
jgi:hypothetical protein